MSVSNQNIGKLWPRAVRDPARSEDKEHVSFEWPYSLDHSWDIVHTDINKSLKAY